METNGKNRFASQGVSIAQMMYVSKYKSHKIALSIAWKRATLRIAVSVTHKRNDNRRPIGAPREEACTFSFVFVSVLGVGLRYSRPRLFFFSFWIVLLVTRKFRWGTWKSLLDGQTSDCVYRHRSPELRSFDDIRLPSVHHFENPLQNLSRVLAAKQIYFTSALCWRDPIDMFQLVWTSVCRRSMWKKRTSCSGLTWMELFCGKATNPAFVTPPSKLCCWIKKDLKDSCFGPGGWMCVRPLVTGIMFGFDSRRGGGVFFRLIRLSVLLSLSELKVQRIWICL